MYQCNYCIHLLHVVMQFCFPNLARQTDVKHIDCLLDSIYWCYAVIGLRIMAEHQSFTTDNNPPPRPLLVHNLTSSRTGSSTIWCKSMLQKYFIAYIGLETIWYGCLGLFFFFYFLCIKRLNIAFWIIDQTYM